MLREFAVLLRSEDSGVPKTSTPYRLNFHTTSWISIVKTLIVALPHGPTSCTTSATYALKSFAASPSLPPWTCTTHRFIAQCASPSFSCNHSVFSITTTTGNFTEGGGTPSRWRFQLLHSFLNLFQVIHLFVVPCLLHSCFYQSASTGRFIFYQQKHSSRNRIHHGSGENLEGS